MTLRDIPSGSKIYETCSDGSTFLIFHRLDGSYSSCTSEKGNLCHLGGSQPLVTHEDGYKFDREAP